ncbi:acyltransferase family protein [bacterium]|nr:acyltransferase family protein [bacterium]
MNKAKARIEFIDIIKGLAIILVVIGHTSPDKTEILPYKSLIYAFHMPLFFILSGMFVATSRENYSLHTLKTFLYKNFIALIVPFMIWGTIYMNFSFSNLAYLCFGSWINFTHIHTLSSLWFIVVLFVARIYLELFYMLINKLKLKTQYAVFVTIPIFFTLGFYLPHHNDILTQNGNFLSYDIAFVAAGFMLIGSLVKPCIKKFVEIKNIYLILLTIVSSLLFMYGFSLTDYTHEFVLMANATYPNIPAFLFCSLAGSFSLISVGILIYKIPIKKRILNFLGQNTLGIFLVHKHFIVTFLVFLQTNTNLNRLSINTIITVTSLVIASLLVVLINRYAPIMFGKINSDLKKN